MADAGLTGEEIEAIEKRAEAATPLTGVEEVHLRQRDDLSEETRRLLATIDHGRRLFADALRAEREANAKLIAVVTAARAMLDTWGEHWDCSASPGHEAMDDPVSALATALDDFTPEGHGG